MADTRIHILLSRSIKLLGVLLLATGYAAAQPRLEHSEIYLGAYGGVNASTVFFSPKVGGMTDLLKVPIGYGGGLMFRYGGHKCCALQVELGYIQRGWREYSQSGGFDYTRTLHYIQLPLLAHVHFGNEHFRGFFNLGPEIGYCLLEQEKGTQQTASVYQYNKIDHPFDWGVAGGLGFYGKARRVGVFQLEIRAQYSFGSLYNNSRAEHFAASNMLTVGATLAYMWQIK